MAKESITRKLAAILYADVAGYSRLTGEDEEATHRALSTSLDAITAAIEGHGGLVLHYAGDAILAEFASVVVAVTCAIDIQRDLAARNHGLSEDRKLQFRIGVNLGDVIVDRGELYGNGVNVAARLESLADAGGICISRKVLHEVQDKLEVGFEFLGDQAVKNIQRPIPVYRVLMDPESAGKVVGKVRSGQRPRPKSFAPVTAIVAVLALALVAGSIAWWQPWQSSLPPAPTPAESTPLPDKPSIAVLPFINMSADQAQEYFVDGMTEDLITDLSKLSNLFVIARNSTFAYKGKSFDVRTVGRELGVRYLLEGSVRRTGNQVRINAQLLDSETGGHLWAERYDGAIDNVFALQDRITREITKALALELTPSETKTISDRGTKVIEAHDAFLKGWSHYLQSTPKGLVTAAEHFKGAIALDANYSRAHAALALTYWLTSQRFWGIHFGFNWKWTRVQMMRHLEKALKSPSIIAHRLASSVYIEQRRYAESIAAAQSAIELGPNSAEAYRALAYALVMNGQPAKGREMVEKAWRLDPRAAGQHFFLLGLIAFAEANLEQAAGLIERAQKHIKHTQSFLPPLIAAYMHLSRTDEGRALSEIYNDSFPAYTTDLRHIMYFWPFRDKAVAARLADGLLLSGIPGKSGGFYNLSDEHRLTGAEIADLFKTFGRIWNVHDVREFGEGSTDLTDTFQEDGTVVRNFIVMGKIGTRKYKWLGRYRIDGDLLCSNFQQVVVGGEGCRPVYRNPDAAPDGNKEYIIVGALGFYKFSPAN